MTREEQELLIKDLCGRLPYGVKIECKWKTPTPNGTYGMLCELDTFLLDQIYNMDAYDVPFDEFKTYLFPLSSLTEEQEKDIFRSGTFFFDKNNTLCRFPKHNDDYNYVTFEDYLEITEKLNKYHIDYRGLIPKGLANDATGLNIY